MALIVEARPEDKDEISSFLRRHVTTSMFLLSNLERHGIGMSDHPHATKFFLHRAADGLTGVFGCTKGGYMMCQHPGLDAPTAAAYLSCLAGQMVTGITGVADQVGCVLDACSGANPDWLLDRVEPLFALNLSELEPPAPPVPLKAPRQEDRFLLEDWFAQYLSETGFSAHSRAGTAATQRSAAAIRERTVQIYLAADGCPIGMTAVNANAARTVQIGGVFIDPAHRNKGHAGRMVAAQLTELRACGNEMALLFAASDAAAKAYTRIGFRRVGDYRVALLREACSLGAQKCP
ncbi:MAG: GNAT family N-acetyltransferase [Roseinatronobacter sp.]